MTTLSMLLVLCFALAVPLSVYLTRFAWISTVTGFFGLLTLFLYFLPSLSTFLPEQDLAKRYSASWALVTGGSSGIGLQIVRKLAGQGLNVCLCALEDELLKKAMVELKKEFPKLEFRAIGVDLASSDFTNYMDKIEKETRDITVQVVFCNAGYVIVDSFARTPIAQSMANLECNTTSHIRITHLFLNRLKEAKLRGAFIYTSSVAGFLPAPALAIYNVGKAALSMFAACLSVECSHLGIDLLVIHPGLVATTLAQKFTIMDTINSLFRYPSSPDTVVSVAFRCIGRVGSIDINPVTYVVRLSDKVCGHNYFTTILKAYIPISPDYKKYAERFS